MKSWRDRAYEVAYRAYLEGKAQGLEGAQLKKHIGKAYPFGPRQYHPYKVWLDVVKRILNPQLRIPQQKIAELMPNPDQQVLPLGGNHD